MIHEPMYAHDGGPAAIARGEANNDGIMAHAFASCFFSCSWGSSHQFAFRLWLSAKPFPDWDGLPKILATTPLCYRELCLNFETAVAIAFPVLYAITHDTLHGKQLASFAAVSCQYARTFSPPSTDGDRAHSLERTETEIELVST